MVALFFGLPGAGKTTVLTSIAYKEINRKKRRYKHIYSNVPLSIEGVTYIDNEVIGNYQLEDCLILIDEATLYADSRDFKNFGHKRLSFFLQHRHYRCDIILFSQQWDGIDRKIRVITDRVYYIYKTPLTGWKYSKYYRIPYGILIPDKKGSGEALGDIVQGYSKPHWFIRLFAHRIKRSKYYKYFDSWDCPQLPPLPDNYKPYSYPPFYPTEV